MRKRLLFLLMLCAALSGCGNAREVDEQPADELALPPAVEVLPSAVEVKPVSEPASVGMISFYPNDSANMNALAGTNAFTIYFENVGIKRGTGRVGIYSADTGRLFASVDTADESNCVIGELDDNGKQITGWEEGSRADLYFSRCFEAGVSYYVLMDAGCFSYNGIASTALTNASIMTFSVKKYGIDGSIDRFYPVGASCNMQILLDGEATKAVLKEYDGTLVSPNRTAFTESGELEVMFLRDAEPSFTISFLKNGAEIDAVTFVFSVSGGETGNVGDSVGDGTIDPESA